MENSCNDVINYVEIKSERRINLLREASICSLTTQAQGPNPFTLHFPNGVYGFIMYFRANPFRA